MDTSSSHILSPDTQAILLLCGHLLPGHEAGESPLTLADYNKLARWLQGQGLRPGVLLQIGFTEQLDAASSPIALGRLRTLLSRSAALAILVESWAGRGGWVLSRSDLAYPTRLKSRLGHQAPALLFGVGAPALLEAGGLAIVGSRDASEGDLRNTRSVAEQCAAHRIQVISGGARGVDSEAMMGAVAGGGTAIGVLASDLAKAAVSKSYRTALRENRLVLISPFAPHARFNVGNAMNRNKHIYTLSDGALVITSTPNKGGTWSGATENLRHQWVPLFVMAGKEISDGNQQLIQQGAHPLDPSQLSESADLPLWAAPSPSFPLPPPTSEAQIGLVAASATLHPIVPEQEGASGPTSHDAYHIMLPHLQQALAIPRDRDALAEYFKIHKPQMAAWLKRAEEERILHLDATTHLYSVRGDGQEDTSNSPTSQNIHQRSLF